VANPELAIVIPAFEEERRLGASLDRICGYLESRGVAAEVIVVDDGSLDSTAQVAASFAARGVRLVRLPENRGKGAAVRAGLLETSARRVLISDADLSTPIEELASLEVAAVDAELAIGSRSVATSRVEVPQAILRELAGKAFNRLVRLGGVRGLADTQCGFKLLDGEVARELARDLVVDRFAWDVELIWLARRRGYRVAEVGVVWRNDPASKVHFLRDSARMAIDLIRLRWRHRHEPPARRRR